MTQILDNKSGIRTLQDLRNEKRYLRSKIELQETVLKTHYASFKTKIQPALNIANFLTHNKLANFVKAGGKLDDDGSLLTSVLKIIMAATASGLVLKNSKSNFFKSIMAYALDQVTKFITEKDLSEHFDKIKEWLSKRGENKEEEKEESSAAE